MSRSGRGPRRFGGRPLFILPAICLLLLVAGQGGAFAWSPAGPWGGVIHDLIRAPAGSTLYAATGNGIYSRGAAEAAWTPLAATLGYRVTNVSADPSGGRLYAIALPSCASYSFNEDDSSPPVGALYSLDLATGLFENLGKAGVSALAVTRGGTLLAGRADGKIWCRDAGSPLFTLRALSPVPVRDLEAFGDTVFAALGRVSGGEQQGSVWRGEFPANAWNIDLSGTAGRYCRSLGGSAGTVAVGLRGGKVLLRGAGSWTEIGAARPLSATYPVVSLGTGPDGSLFAVQRMHTWFGLDDGHASPGLYRYDDPTNQWVFCDTSRVSTQVSKVLADGPGLLVAFDQSGLRRVSQVGGEWRFPDAPEWDRGISAACLNGVAVDPRGQGRALAYGPSGLYERNGGEWRRVLLDHLVRIPYPQSDYLFTPFELFQKIRETEIRSAAFSPSDPEGVWLGCHPDGLFYGRMMPGDSGTWTQRYVAYAGRGSVNRVKADPYADDEIWWASSGGIHHSYDGGVSRQSFFPSAGWDPSYPFLDLSFDLAPPEDGRLYLASRNDATYKGVNWSADGATWPPGTIVPASDSIVSSLVMPASPDLAGVFLIAPDTGTIPLGVDKVTRDFVPGMAAPSGPGLDPDGWSEFLCLDAPGGVDSSGLADAYAVVGNYEYGVYVRDQYYTSTWLQRVFHSEARPSYPPGEAWQEMADPTGIELPALEPVSVTVDPKDGDLLWVATHHGSVFTVKPGFFRDDSGPDFPPASPPGSRRLRVLGTTATTLTLAWKAPGDDGYYPGWADRYELRIGPAPFPDDGGFPSWGGAITTPAPHIAGRDEVVAFDSSAFSGTRWAFALRAVDDADHPSPLLTAVFVRGSLPPLGSPLADAALDRVVLSWNTSPLAGEAGFVSGGRILVFRTVGGVEALAVGLPPDAAGWTDLGTDLGGFTPTESVFYRLEARAADGACSEVSCEDSIPIPAVASPLARFSAGSVVLTWDPSPLDAVPGFAGAGSIVVFRRTQGPGWVRIATLGPTAGSLTDDGADLAGGLDPGVAVDYEIEARIGAHFSVAACRAGYLPPLGSPIADASSVQVRITWDPSPLLSGYPAFTAGGSIIVYRTAPGTEIQLAVLSPTATEWIDDGADLGGFPPGVRVSYRLEAWENGTGIFSEVRCGDYTPLPPVGVPSAAYSAKTVLLSWDPSPLGAVPGFAGSGHIVVIRNARGFENQVADLPSGAAGWTDRGTGLSGGFASGETVYYLIQARDAAGNFADAQCQVTIPAPPPPTHGGGGGGCFIATAAFGTPMEPEVDILRIYRERYLKEHGWGRALVRVYERVSPGPARFIARHPALRAVARGALRPIVWCVGATGAQGPWAALTGFGVALSPLLFVILLFIAGTIKGRGGPTPHEIGGVR
jgi:hypothetical protein